MNIIEWVCNSRLVLYTLALSYTTVCLYVGYLMQIEIPRLKKRIEGLEDKMKEATK